MRKKRLKYICPLIFCLLWGCATNSISYPGDPLEYLEEKNRSQTLRIAVLKNPALQGQKDENYKFLKYLRDLETFDKVDLVEAVRPEYDYVFHCTISHTATRSLYRTGYICHLATLGIFAILGVSTHDSYADYLASFIVYHKGKLWGSYLLQNRREYWFDNIYWSPKFTKTSDFSPLFDGFLYLFDRDVRSSVK